MHPESCIPSMRFTHPAHFGNLLIVRQVSIVLLQLAFVPRLSGVAVDSLQPKVILEAANMTLVMLLQTKKHESHQVLPEGTDARSI